MYATKVNCMQPKHIQIFIKISAILIYVGKKPYLHHSIKVEVAKLNIAKPDTARSGRLNVHEKKYSSTLGSINTSNLVPRLVH